MGRWRSLGMKAALTGALALGLGLGLVSQAAVTSAQTTPTAEATTGTSSLASRFLDQLAAALGVQRAALDSAMGSAASDTLAAAVADGTLSQERADALAARAQAGDYGALLGGRGGPGGPGGRHGGARVEGLHTAMTEAAAQALGISADELRTALRDGQTVAELAAANGTTEQAVTDAALAAAKTQLDAAVAAGTLTQADADTIYADLEARGLELRGRGGPRGGRGGPPAESEPAPATSTSDA